MKNVCSKKLVQGNEHIEISTMTLSLITSRQLWNLTNKYSIDSITQDREKVLKFSVVLSVSTAYTLVSKGSNL